MFFFFGSFILRIPQKGLHTYGRWPHRHAKTPQRRLCLTDPSPSFITAEVPPAWSRSNKAHKCCFVFTIWPSGPNKLESMHGGNMGLENFRAGSVTGSEASELVNQEIGALAKIANIAGAKL